MTQSKVEIRDSRRRSITFEQKSGHDPGQKSRPPYAQVTNIFFRIRGGEVVREMDDGIFDPWSELKVSL